MDNAYIYIYISKGGFRYERNLGTLGTALSVMYTNPRKKCFFFARAGEFRCQKFLNVFRGLCDFIYLCLCGIFNCSSVLMMNKEAVESIKYLPVLWFTPLYTQVPKLV